MRGLLDGMLDLLLPPGCFRCGALGRESLCSACHGALPAPPELPTRRPPLARLAAGAAYAGELEDWLQRFKYPSGALALDPAPEAVLGALLVRGALPLERPQLVLPVPLHAKRLRSRGFNPAARLAKRLARELGLPHDPVVVARTRDTPSQTGLDARARGRNVAGAFAVRRPVPERIWIVDDVITTGATVQSVARALRDAGAKTLHAVAPLATP